MNFYGLEPLEQNFCMNCGHVYLDIGESGNERRHICEMHPEINLDEDLHYIRINDCKDILFLANDAVTSTFARAMSRKAPKASKTNKAKQLELFEALEKETKQ